MPLLPNFHIPTVNRPIIETGYLFLMDRSQHISYLEEVSLWIDINRDYHFGHFLFSQSKWLQG